MIHRPREDYLIPPMSPDERRAYFAKNEAKAERFRRKGRRIEATLATLGQEQIARGVLKPSAENR
jgi:hypothetical protein